MQFKKYFFWETFACRPLGVTFVEYNFIILLAFGGKKNR
jgi:hypothetical protein